MDTPTDFLFLNERISTNFNPFYEGEYSVIQTYPREIGLRISKRDFDYHGQKYGENLLVCGIYPHGYQGEICPDFQDKVKVKD